MLVCVFGELGRTSLELDAVQVCALGSSPPHILHTPAARALLVVVICAHAFGELPGLQEEPQIAAFLTLHSCHSVAGHRSYNGRHQEAPLHRVWKLPLNEHLQAKSHTSACQEPSKVLVRVPATPANLAPPVTKVKTPFMKAFDWQAAYSSSPWNWRVGDVFMAQFSFLQLFL